jgi:hypothetical protein
MLSICIRLANRGNGLRMASYRLLDVSSFWTNAWKVTIGILRGSNKCARYSWQPVTNR